MNITAASWLKKVSENRSGADEAFVAGLSGHLGAGKTAFVKAVANEVGMEEGVTSPTLVIMKSYEIDTNKSAAKNATQNGAFKRLVHIDAYRLERREELEALRFEEIVADPGNLVMIEWPENVGLTMNDGGALDAWLKFDIKDGVYTIANKIVDK